MHSSIRNISKEFKVVILIVFSSSLLFEFFPLVLRMTGDFKSISGVYWYYIIYQILALIYTVLLAVYYHKKRYKVARNAYIIYVASAFVFGLFGGVLMYDGLADWSTLLINLMGCLQLFYLITLFYSKAKNSKILMIYGILASTWALIVLVETMILDELFYTDYNSIVQFILSIIMLVHMSAEPTGNEELAEVIIAGDDILDNSRRNSI